MHPNNSNNNDNDNDNDNDNNNTVNSIIQHALTAAKIPSRLEPSGLH